MNPSRMKEMGQKMHAQERVTLPKLFGAHESLWGYRWRTMVCPLQGRDFEDSRSKLHICQWYALKGGNDIVWLTFWARLMVCQLVYNDDLLFMREHHGVKETWCNDLHGIHDASPKHNVIIEWCIHDLHVEHDFLPNEGDGNIMV